jgi:hypothetical protein
MILPLALSASLVGLWLAPPPSRTLQQTIAVACFGASAFVLTVAAWFLSIPSGGVFLVALVLFAGLLLATAVILARKPRAS